MITEDYVSREVAKLLKEKGFNELCSRYYNSQFDEMRTVGDICMMNWNSISINDEFYYISIPTHQMAMKWLKGKGIECVIIPIWNTIGKQYRYYVLSDLGDKYKDNYDSYSDNISYEEAVEAALKYALENLI